MSQKSTVSFTTIVSWTHKVSLSLLLLLTSSGKIGLTQSANDEEKIKLYKEVIDNQVILSVKATNGYKLSSYLTSQDISVYVDCPEKKLEDCTPITLDSLKKPSEAKSSPAYIVFLLDLSGSMKKDDQSGKTKLQGAIEALRSSLEMLAKRNSDTQIVIVPFSSSQNAEVYYKNCQDDPVTYDKLNQFNLVTSGQYEQQLTDLETNLQDEINYEQGNSKRPQGEKSRICGETNLYQSLNTTIYFLSNLQQQKQEEFAANNKNSNKDSELQTTFHIVLLSDGFDTVGLSSNPNICDESHFQLINDKLNSLKNQNQELKIHTIGYGITPEALSQKSEYQTIHQGNIASCEQVRNQKNSLYQEIKKEYNNAPEKNLCSYVKINTKNQLLKETCELIIDFESELVDKAHLDKLATVTGGFHRFSGNADEIANQLKFIIEAITDQYELSYTQPSADSATAHTVQVVVTQNGEKTTSKIVPYNIGFIFLMPWEWRKWTFLLFIMPMGIVVYLWWAYRKEI
jgi:hypothetical protein